MKRILFITLYFILIYLLSACNHGKELTNINKSDCIILENQIYNIDSIIKEQQLELENENIRDIFQTLIKEKIECLNKSRSDKNISFPFSNIDSAVYIKYENYEYGPITPELENRKPIDTMILCKEKTTEIINLINNPNNFDYSECGTQVPESQILFYFRGGKVAVLIFSCNRKQIECKPHNILCNFGALNESGYEKLNKINPWQ